ncbi:lipid-A-disaccharide synthase [Campylobacter sp. MIT 99-7217]|nr:lipid-A-disaccharide synthase [Campylobacter sp. MIT 99-7217]TQR32327.1 lipid-A-disaccharide synthase [Campylobacter sp. MIT 99-7217]
MKTFLVCALEPSANLHLKELLKAYKKEFGEFDLVGIYDESLCEEFCLRSKPLYSSHEFSAMGFVEILPLVFKAKKACKELVSLVMQSEGLKSKNALNLENQGSFTQENLEQSPKISAILCIDSPAFNIPLAKALKKAHSKTKRIYYILPQVWAWKKGRIPVIEAHFDALASILPFDEQFFSKSVYVGHPLLDELKEFKDEKDFEALLKKEEKEKLIAFLPGSRKSEITRLMPVFRDLASKFSAKKVLCVPPFNLNRLEIYGDLDGFEVKSNTPAVLKKADFAFICSGTATLEAALIGTPFILAYKAKSVDFFIAKCFVKLKHIGLANIFCDFAGKSELNPEFLQAEVNVLNLYEAYKKFDYKEFFAKVSFLKEYLRFGSARNLAKILFEIDKEK